MNLKAILLLVCIGAISACGHLRPNNSKNDHKLPETQVETAENGFPIEPEDTQAPATIDTQEKTEPQPPEAAPLPQINLLTRIRNGFTFPELDSKYIAEYERWDATHPTYLNNLFLRAEPFLFHIVEEIEKRGLPMELALLPAIESAYKPNAVSRSRAAGLWQFVPATGREYGLRQDWWYDGRRDVLASTDAALTYLSRLNKMFDGDWFLTLAAYNAGPGTVKRAIKSNQRRRKKTDYQSLKLRSETRRYVPKLIALKNILLNPEKFNLTLPVIDNELHFEVVELPGQIDLHEFANNADIKHRELLTLNAGFRRWATSPQGPHRVLVPVTNTANIDKAKLAISKAPKIEYRNHTITRGDSLSSISRRYGVTISALKTTNNMRDSRIRAGRSLLIPIRGAINPIPAVQKAVYRPGNAAKTNKVVHRVRRGDTLWSIARRYKVQIGELLSWNNISSDQILNLNQSLLVFTR